MTDRRSLAARLTVVVFLVFTASGCQTMAQPSRDDLVSMDDQDCRSMGLKFGTSPYADCRLRVAQMRQDRTVAAATFLMNRSVPVAPVPAATYVPITKPTNCNSMVGGNLISTSCN